MGRFFGFALIFMRTNGAGLLAVETQRPKFSANSSRDVWL